MINVDFEIRKLVAGVREAQANFVPIEQTRMDTDFYKFPMGHFIERFFPDVEVEFEFINRHKHIPLARIIDEEELRHHIDYFLSLRFTRTDICWLRGQDYYGKNLFSDEYLEFLSKTDFKKVTYTLTKEGDQYRIKFKGPWGVVTFCENPCMVIVTGLLYRKLLESMTDTELESMYRAAYQKLLAKLLLLRERPWITFADFGQRRRHSFLWQLFVIKLAKDVMGNQFTGASNTWMSFNQDVPARGTNAHELPMVLTALEDDDRRKVLAQYRVLHLWEMLYPEGGLRIILPDTYGSKQFYDHMDPEYALHVARTWRGPRLDSGDPIQEGNDYLKWLASFGIDPIKENKILIPSDGLDIDSILAFDDEFRDRIAYSFGWGTKFTNDFDGCHPRGGEEAVIDGQHLGLTWNELLKGHSFVCKVASANGRSAVKLSNNVKKATGDSKEVAHYIELFGNRGRTSQEVKV